MPMTLEGHEASAQRDGVKGASLRPLALGSLASVSSGSVLQCLSLHIDTYAVHA